MTLPSQTSGSLSNSTLIKSSLSRRNIAVDGLRGLLLLVIAINHLESAAITPFTVEPFGFVSAAEGFIFLSGFVAAMVYGRLVGRPRELKRKIWFRVSHLYLYTLVGVIAVFIALHTRLLSDIWYRDWGAYFLLENYLLYPFESLLLNVFQIQQMGYLDILVLYMVPMVCLPWVLLLLHRDKVWFVLIVSAGIWMAAQWIDDGYLKGAFLRLGIQSKVDAGYMDILAWQFLFYLGVVAGFYQTFKSIDIIANRKISVGVCLLAIGFFLMDKTNIQPQTPELISQVLFGWKDLGVVRLLNTLVLAYLAALIIRHFPYFFSLKALVYLGEHSLQVFTFHAVAIFFFLPWMYEINKMYSVFADISLVLFFILTLYFPAWLHQKWRKKRQVGGAS